MAVVAAVLGPLQQPAPQEQPTAGLASAAPADSPATGTPRTAQQPSALALDTPPSTPAPPPPRPNPEQSPEQPGAKPNPLLPSTAGSPAATPPTGQAAPANPLTNPAPVKPPAAGNPTNRTPAGQPVAGTPPVPAPPGTRPAVTFPVFLPGLPPYLPALLPKLPGPPRPALPKPVVPKKPVAPGLSGPAAAVVALTNTERLKAGCKPLRVDSRLNLSAQRHSADMARRDYFEHESPEGEDFADREAQAGFKGDTGGENIAMGQTSASEVMNDWMHSPGHRRNILDCSYTMIGVGYVPSGHYWTQNFGG